MSKANWEGIGKQLVDSWYKRNMTNKNIPQSMLDDVADVLKSGF